MSTTTTEDSPTISDLPQKKLDKRQKLQALAPPDDLPIFKNWYAISGKDGREVKMALSQNALCDQFKKLMPECVAINETLHIINNETVKPITNSKRLSVAIRKKDILLDFQPKLTFGLPMDEFYEAALQEVPQYETYSKYPRWPLLQSNLVLRPIGHLFNGCLDTLVDMFSYASPTDRSLLKAAIISPCWSDGWGERPLFMISGENKSHDDDQGTGKSSFLMILEKLYGVSGTVTVGLSPDRQIAQFQSFKNQNIRLIKIDNVRDLFANSILESYITEEWIGGYKLGAGHSVVHNDFTFFATGNSPQMNRDMADRTCLIHLKRPAKRDPMWRQNLVKWLDANIEPLLADIGSYLVSPSRTDLTLSPGAERWGRWVSTILHKVDPEAHHAMGAGKEELQANDDHIIFDDRLRSFATHYYSSQESSRRLDPESDSIFITNDLIFDIYREAFNTNCKKSPAVFTKINTMAKRLGLTRPNTQVRIDGLGLTRGYIINYDETARQKPVFILVKHHRHGHDAVFHQPISDFVGYIK